MKNEVKKLLNGRGLPKQEILTLELNMNYICKDTIKKRKKIYGNNFEEIAKLQSEYLGIEISAKDVAYTLAILKQVRIDFIKAKLLELRDNPRFSDYDIQIQIKDLRNGLEDSLKDFHNYLFISQNYSEYEAL